MAVARQLNRPKKKKKNPQGHNKNPKTPRSLVGPQ